MRLGQCFHYGAMHANNRTCFSLEAPMDATPRCGLSTRQQRHPVLTLQTFPCWRKQQVCFFFKIFF